MKKIVLVLFLLIFTGCVTDDSLYNLKEGRTSTSIVSEKTHSMYPTYVGGETVIIRKEKFDNVKVGDIIIYRNYQNYNVDYVIHRVIWRDSESLICKGDNNGYIDEHPIFKCHYIGTAIGVKY